VTSGSAGRADFAVFVAARSQRLLRTAYLLTQDRGTAEDLLQTALAKSWQAWGRIDDDPEPYVRAVIVNTYTSWWRRGRHGGIATGALPEPAEPAAGTDVGDRLALWQAMGRLPRRQRAVLVLRYLEDLSEAETAKVLGVAVGTVESQSSQALAVTESDIAEAFREWTDQLPPAADRLGAVEQRIRRHRNRVRAAGAAAVCAVIVGAAFVSGHTSTARDQGPAVRRGPSHPAMVLPAVFAGSVVSGQVSGSGTQTRSTTLVWPESSRLALAAQCSADGGMLKISVSGEPDPLSTACGGIGAILTVDAAPYFPHVPANAVVTVTVGSDSGVTGPWVVGVLDRDPRWLDGSTPPQAYQGARLRHWVSGGISASASVQLTAADTHPVFQMICGQAGRLSLLLNGQDVGTVNCADAPWSEQVLPVSEQTLTTAGFVPGRRASMAFGWEGQTWAYVGVAEYAG
jgi:RNA polymerase sigma-70 factor (sigma-E family)